MPRVWVIDPYRAGERSQVRALANALGWPFDVKSLSYRRWAIHPHLLESASIAGIQRQSRAMLQAPWPDLVITSGVRNEPVCRWIRHQSQGRTRYIHVGRPWAQLDSFDLVITTPQYRVPEHSKVLHNALTLNDSHNAGSNPKPADHNYSRLPAPRIAVLVGGNSGPFTFGPRAAQNLTEQASALARRYGGWLMISTSARTPEAVVHHLASSIDVPHTFYRWRADDPGNPYRQILALADRLIVSGDSIGMLSEACSTGKPVHIFDLGGMREDSQQVGDSRLGGTLYRWMLQWLWQPLSRDITLVHRQLVASGRASWLDLTETTGHRQSPPPNDLERAVAAVKSLLD